MDQQPTAEKMLDWPNAAILPWEQASDLLDQGGVTWLATTNPDGSPHLVPVGAVWLDGAMYTVTGQGTRKGANLDARPACAVSLASAEFDMIVEGVATKTHDQATLEKLAVKYNAQEWPVVVKDGAFDAPFNAPTTGPKPYEVYEIKPTTIFAQGTKDETVNLATRYRF